MYFNNWSQAFRSDILDGRIIFSYKVPAFRIWPSKKLTEIGDMNFLVFALKYVDTMVGCN